MKVTSQQWKDLIEIVQVGHEGARFIAGTLVKGVNHLQSTEARCKLAALLRGIREAGSAQNPDSKCDLLSKYLIQYCNTVSAPFNLLRKIQGLK